MASKDQTKNIQHIVERLSCVVSKTVENLLFGKAYEETQESLTDFVKTNLVVQNIELIVEHISEHFVQHIVERLLCFMSKTVENLVFGKATYEETQESLTEFVKTNLVIQISSPTEQTRPVEIQKPSSQEAEDRKTFFLKRLDEVVDVYTGDSSFLDKRWEAYDEQQIILSPGEFVVLVKKVAENFDSLPVNMKSSLLDTLVDGHHITYSKGELVLYSKKRPEVIWLLN